MGIALLLREAWTQSQDVVETSSWVRPRRSQDGPGMSAERDGAATLTPCYRVSQSSRG